MNITSSFKALAKNHTESNTRKIRRKLLDVDKFNSKAHAIKEHISQLREYLIDNRSRYVNFSNSLTSMHMEDEERHKIDMVVKQIITNCHKLIKELSHNLDLTSIHANAQLYEHKKCLLQILEEYLKETCEIYVEMKTFHAKRNVNYHKMKSYMCDDTKANSPSNRANVVYGGKKESQSRDELESHEGSQSHDSATFLDSLTPEEMQLFELENEHILKEIGTMSNEVKSIEKNAVEIANLQEMFTSKVLEQQSQVSRIDTQVFAVTENLKDAKTELKKSIMQNAASRLYVLFFLLVMSFSLLFLNWYNP